MKFDTILFDLDGTLLNTLDDLADSVNMVMETEGYPLRTKDEIKAFIGDGVKLLMKRALPDHTDEEEVQRCLTLFREIYKKNMLNQTNPYPGIQELLNQLKNMNLKIGVISNKPDLATKELCGLFFQGKVDAAIGDNHERQKKPAPDNVFEAMKQLQSSREGSLYLGDSNVDMQTAKNAGLTCVGVTWGYRSREVLLAEGADFIIDKPDQLIGLIRS